MTAWWITVTAKVGGRVTRSYLDDGGSYDSGGDQSENTYEIGFTPRAKQRRELRKNIVEFKKHRRISLGPYATFYFECYETMLAQIQEMLYIEKGGEDQLKDEIERLANSNDSNKKRKIENLKKRDTLGGINFDSVIKQQFFLIKMRFDVEKLF